MGHSMGGGGALIAPVDEHAGPHFRSIPESTPRVYPEVDGGSHFLAESKRGTHRALARKYVIVWLWLHLEDDDRYRELIYGDARNGDSVALSRYVTSP